MQFVATIVVTISLKIYTMLNSLQRWFLGQMYRLKLQNLLMNSTLQATAQGDDYCECTSLKATLLLHNFCLTLSLPPRNITHFQEADIDRLIPLEAWLLLLGVLDVYGLASWLWRGGANIGGRPKKGGKNAGGLRPCASAALHHSEKRESKLPYNTRVDNLNETGLK